jgi:hypothetical protein
MEQATEVEKGHKPGEHAPHVVVLYNGMSREITYRPEELVEQIRQRAIAAFAITQNPHLLSLWTEGGSELSDNLTAHSAGIHPNERLLLRPGAVKGGYAR